MAYGTRFMIGAAMFAVAVAAQPVEAEFDQQGADCFFAENREHLLCRETGIPFAARSSVP